MARPDHADQALMDPTAAAAYWIEHIAWRDAKKVSPGTSGCPRGKEWLQQFMSACGGKCDVCFP